MKISSIAIVLLVPLLGSGCSVSRGNCEQVSLTERERCMTANEDSRSKVEARKQERKRAQERVALKTDEEQGDSKDRQWIP